ncbi:alpha/beta fold hydrolase [Falsiroseomonas selenitidurans]|uniref:Alpha/beta hydrolase n=1 Tax=Falsiroseomonas selenitidurans TaxID=2716335 RepID=A0ABX1DY35_9PROT|nr:alpha/beta fold hydrolase [Falsiroseomonas selenitidurans]NKC29280.1 alpha/beta hydrolase [Falsiroseomonas selenitidurans]
MRRGGLRYLLGAAFHRLAWTEWGPPEGAAVVCVHGLTRNGRDFDVLAAALAGQGRRVLCPDLPGRGDSAWLPDPMAYAPPAYVVALGHLLARLDGPVDWVGTSLGGICGMLLAAAPGSPIRRLVLNDIGSHVPEAATVRIAAYARQGHRFEDLAGLEAHLRQVHAGFGPLEDAAWRHMAETSARRLPDGGIAPHHDPAIAVPLARARAAPIELGAVWDRVVAPTLILRGAESDVLEAATAAAMAARPGVALREFAGVGHAPALRAADQVAAVADFLAA